VLPRGLYVITDSALSQGRSHDQVVEAALRGGATTIQLRDKRCPRADLLAAARRLSALCREAGALFIVNDDPYLAAEAGADGVHLGPSDMPPFEARGLLGEQAVIGWSVKGSIELARQASRMGVDYLAVGSIFPTTTKEGAVVVGVEAIRNIRAAVELPIAAIGGIDLDSVVSVIQAGAVSACVISAAVGAPDVEAACRELSQAIAAAQTVH